MFPHTDVGFVAPSLISGMACNCDKGTTYILLACCVVTMEFALKNVADDENGISRTNCGKKICSCCLASMVPIKCCFQH